MAVMGHASVPVTQTVLLAVVMLEQGFVPTGHVLLTKGLVTFEKGLLDR
jgi:hypothetical protein